MPDGDGGVGRQVDGRLHGEEAVDLPFVPNLAAKVVTFIVAGLASGTLLLMSIMTAYLFKL